MNRKKKFLNFSGKKLSSNLQSKLQSYILVISWKLFRHRNYCSQCMPDKTALLFYHSSLFGTLNLLQYLSNASSTIAANYLFSFVLVFLFFFIWLGGFFVCVSGFFFFSLAKSRASVSQDYWFWYRNSCLGKIRTLGHFFFPFLHPFSSLEKKTHAHEFTSECSVYL